VFKEEIEQYGLDHMLAAKKVLDDVQKYITEEKAKWQVAAGDLLERMEKAKKGNKEE
tara:strand:- start:246 stop:416 length:171 start_codon:yes stop_codon:yes gene_type:complete